MVPLVYFKGSFHKRRAEIQLVPEVFLPQLTFWLVGNFMSTGKSLLTKSVDLPIKEFWLVTCQESTTGAAYVRPIKLF